MKVPRSNVKMSIHQEGAVLLARQRRYSRTSESVKDTNMEKITTNPGNCRSQHLSIKEGITSSIKPKLTWKDSKWSQEIYRSRSSNKPTVLNIDSRYSVQDLFLTRKSVKLNVNHASIKIHSNHSWLSTSLGVTLEQSVRDQGKITSPSQEAYIKKTKTEEAIVQLHLSIPNPFYIILKHCNL